MNILDVLKQLRDDIKIWVANNLNDLNTRLTKSINNIPKFSGSYNDLTDAPNIAEDDSGNMIIADESGNIIFKADSDGIHTTAVSLNGEAAASQKYVDEAIANVNVNVDLTGYATENSVTAAIDSVKAELSESIISESEDWKIVDNDGNIIFSIDNTGAHTTALSLNGESIENIIDEKVDKVDGKGLSTNDFTNEYKDKLDNLNGTGGIQSDWNENDEASNAYIQNRTHYLSENEIFNDVCEYCYEEDILPYKHNLYNYTSFKNELIDIKSKYDIVIGNIKFIDVMFEKTMDIFQIEGHSEGLYISIHGGNLDIYIDQAPSDYRVIIIEKNVKQLDEMYIPDTIARVDEIPSLEELATKEYVNAAVVDKTNQNAFSSIFANGDIIEATSPTDQITLNGDTYIDVYYTNSDDDKVFHFNLDIDAVYNAIISRLSNAEEASF